MQLVLARQLAKSVWSCDFYVSIVYFIFLGEMGQQLLFLVSKSPQK